MPTPVLDYIVCHYYRNWIGAFLLLFTTLLLGYYGSIIILAIFVSGVLIGSIYREYRHDRKVNGFLNEHKNT